MKTKPKTILLSEVEVRCTVKKKPCICLQYAGMLNFTTYGKPISDCCICNGTGKV